MIGEEENGRYKEQMRKEGQESKLLDCKDATVYRERVKIDTIAKLKVK